MLAETWAEYDAKHLIIETRHLAAHEIETAVERIAGDLGLRKTVV